MKSAMPELFVTPLTPCTSGPRSLLTVGTVAGGIYLGTCLLKDSAETGRLCSQSATLQDFVLQTGPQTLTQEQLHYRKANEG